MGIYSGNPACEDDYTSGTCHTFEGKALALVRSFNRGQIEVVVKSHDVGESKVVLEAK